jgi:hypothetical protein
MDMNARFGVPFAFFLMTLSANAKDIPSDCKRFFDRAKLPADSDCAAKCGILMTDMATFNCPEFCDLYCNNKRSVEGDEPPSEFSLSGLYPGLTTDEPQEERAINLANNRRGILASSESIKNRSPTDQDIVGLFEKDLKSGKLVVLRRNSP